MATKDDVKIGAKILIEGDPTPYEVVKSEHIKQARGAGMEKTILKNLLTQTFVPKTFKEFDKVTPADVSQYSRDYLYNDMDGYHFMNPETYEQITLSDDIIGNNKNYLQDGDRVRLQTFEGKTINIELEPFVVLIVESTPPGERGDTATGGKKPATMNTGLVIQVPLFINIGDKLKIDSRTSEYISRA